MLNIDPIQQNLMEKAHTIQLLMLKKQNRLSLKQNMLINQIMQNSMIKLNTIKVTYQTRSKFKIKNHFMQNTDLTLQDSRDQALIRQIIMLKKHNKLL